MVILSHKKSGIVLKLWHVNANSVDVMRLNILNLGMWNPYGSSRVKKSLLKIINNDIHSKPIECHEIGTRTHSTGSCVFMLVPLKCWR